MANEVHSPPEPGAVTALVSGILNDAQELMKQQITLVRQEIQDDFRKTKEGVISLALGVGTAFLGGFLLCLTAVHLLKWSAPDLPEWVCYAIVTGIVIVLSGALLFAGKKRFDSFNPLPDQSLQGLKENLQWKTNPNLR